MLEQQTDLSDYPRAKAVRDRSSCTTQTALRVIDDDLKVSLETEIVRVRTGPGMVVFTGAFEVARSSTARRRLRSDDRRRSGHAAPRAGDHFAKPGANDRVWNALEKLAVATPDAFVAYYANDVMALVCWPGSGPAYQVTSQVNVVNPGGAAQTVHRDYHLGFQSDEGCVSSRRTCTTVPGADAPGRGRSRGHAAGVRSDALPAAPPEVLAGLCRLPPPGVPGATSTTTTCSSRWRRVTRSSSTLRCFHAAGSQPLHPTSGGWPTSCRSRPPSAARWRSVDRGRVVHG